MNQDRGNGHFVKNSRIRCDVKETYSEEVQTTRVILDKLSYKSIITCSFSLCFNGCTTSVAGVNDFHLEMSLKRFRMAAVALFSASEQTHCTLVDCD